MEIVWDETKRKSNIETHRIDFATFHAFDWTSAVLRPTYAGRFGQRRMKVLGNDLVTAILADLGTEAISIISLRRAGPRTSVALMVSLSNHEGGTWFDQCVKSSSPSHRRPSSP